MTCSSPDDCAELERRLSTATACCTDDGASRGNLFSGEADAVILTVSRMNDEKRANPGYRAFLANGFNVTRTLVLFVWEVVIERVAAVAQRRRDVSPAGAPRGPLSVHACGRLRRRPRPDRVRGPDRHDARAPRGLRDVLEL